MQRKLWPVYNMHPSNGIDYLQGRVASRLLGYCTALLPGWGPEAAAVPGQHLPGLPLEPLRSFCALLA